MTLYEAAFYRIVCLYTFNGISSTRLKEQTRDLEILLFYCCSGANVTYRFCITIIMVTDNFSSPGRAVGLIFVSVICLRVRAITFELDDLWPRYSAFLLILTLFRSFSKVGSMGQSSRSQKEDVAKVVGATSSETFQCSEDCCWEYSNVAMFYYSVSIARVTR